MNVFLYITLVMSAGLSLAYTIGRSFRTLRPVASVFASIGVSVFLGGLLAFPVLIAVGSLCTKLGINERECIRTDNQTVWFLALPLAAFPLYALVMLVARAACQPRIAGVWREP